MKIRIVAKQDITNVLDKEGLLALNAYYEEIVECDVYDRISISLPFLLLSMQSMFLLAMLRLKMQKRYVRNNLNCMITLYYYEISHIRLKRTWKIIRKKSMLKLKN